MNVSLTKKIIELGYMNSYDTWHGTKGVAKAMKSIASGPKRDVGNKWFTQLSDKCVSHRTITHVPCIYFLRNTLLYMSWFACIS
jgi:hypothetical protein